jgi:hypothetical protein
VTEETNYSAVTVVLFFAELIKPLFYQWRYPPLLCSDPCVVGIHGITLERSEQVIEFLAELELLGVSWHMPVR